MIEVTLPYPPSVNTYWRRNGRRYFVSERGRAFQANVYAALCSQRPAKFGIDVRLAVEVDLYPPDKRSRDIDNTQKSLLDALAKGGLFVDDSQVDDLRIKRCEVRKGGLAVVRIRSMQGG